MQLSDDRTQATLAINKTLTAPEIENLIRELATLRSQMTPEVTTAPKDSNGDGVPVMRQDNPTLAIEYPLEEAYVTVYLRSLGLAGQRGACTPTCNGDWPAFSTHGCHKRRRRPPNPSHFGDRFPIRCVSENNRRSTPEPLTTIP